MIFIFLVVVAPGITDAMFYYEANVLEFTSTNFGYLGVISCFASIIGVWVYRAFCTKLRRWNMFIYIFWMILPMGLKYKFVFVGFTVSIFNLLQPQTLRPYCIIILHRFALF